MNSRQATENGEPVQENEVRFHIPTPVENQPEDVKSPLAQDPTPEPGQGNKVHLHISTPVENQPEDVESPHPQDPTPQRDSGSISPQARVLTLLRERGRDSQLDRQIIKGS